MTDEVTDPALRKARPRWDRDGGTHELQRRDGIDHLVRHKPNVRHICGPLMGSTKTRADGSKYAQYPQLNERLALYQEGLEVVKVFRDPDDVFALALYRRQLVGPGEPCDRGFPVDHEFFVLAECLLGLENTHIWHQLAGRMPHDAPIRDWCLAHARSSSAPRATVWASNAA